MSWLTFFAVWGLLIVAFVAGCGWAGGNLAQAIDIAERALGREEKLRGMLEASNRLLEQATKRQPHITILPGVEQAEEQFDWRGAGL